MNITAIVEALVDAGATPEMILAAVRSAEQQKDAATESSKAKARDRVARWRQANPGNVTERHVTAQNDLQRLASVDARGEDNSLPQKIEPQESKKEQSAQARLEGVLDRDHAKAVVDHRQRLRKPLTPYAAKLLADKLATFQDPNAAADKMIERGWQTVYPDEPPQLPRGSPPQKKPSLADAFGRVAELAEYRNDARRAESFGSVQPAIPHLSGVSSRRS